MSATSNRKPPPYQKGAGVRPRLRDKLVAYFARNEDEVLCISDIRVKFGVDPTTARSSVRLMRQCGLVHTERRDRTSPIFVSAGPALLKVIRGAE